MLSRGKTYGHELMKAVHASRAEMWVSLSEKHVYYVLQTLAKKGCVTETEERRGPRPPRKIYQITPAGKKALLTLLRSRALQESFAPSPFDAVVGILAYSDLADRELALEVLRARRKVLARRLDEAHPAAPSAELEVSYGYLARSLYDKARALLKAELKWIDTVIAQTTERDWESLRVPRDFMKRARGER
jgi:DNA-binding PadR family transcriptional regulator